VVLGGRSHSSRDRAADLVGLASFSILARLLAPADFGLLALATSVIAVVELFGQAGVNLALIARRSASRDEYDTAWTLDVIVGVIVAAVVLASAAALAVVLHEPRVERILYWLAIASAIGGFQNIGIVEFQKSFQFSKEFRLRITTRTLKAITTIAFALVWRDFGLVAGYVTGMLVNRNADVRDAPVPAAAHCRQSRVHALFGLDAYPQHLDRPE